jgi:hypothetical protein
LNSQHKPIGQFVPGMVSTWPCSAQAGEALVVDVRARLTPADMVDRKFEDLLMRHPFAASHLRRDVPRDRSRKKT